MAAVVVRLPDDLRDDLKPPLGPVFSDVDALLEAAGAPLVAVGDVVTAHLERAGHRPDLALIDDRTERSPVDDALQSAISTPDRQVANPAATITGALVEAMRSGLESEEPTTIFVEGEEDLAGLPAVLLAPDGASVVYGQPGEGMVLVTVDPETRGQVRSLLERFDGDVADLLGLIGASSG
ncbi:MAG: GTP-dependent dephospho-CoA kinase family protein [Halobacteriales archaeon]